MVRPYVGLPIQWLVTLEVVSPSDSEYVHLMLLDEGKYPWVYCNARIADYPQIKTAHQGSILWIAGTIIGGDENGMRIDLEGIAFV